MCFRKFSIIFVLISLLLGCSKYLDEGEVENEISIETQSSLTCMKEDGFAFFEEKDNLLDKGQITKLFSCLDSLTEILNNHVNQKNFDTISRSAVEELIVRKMGGDKVEYDHIVHLFYSIKKDILGGSDQEFSHQEIVKFRVFLREFEVIYLENLPLLKIFAGSLKGKSAEQAEQQLSTSLKSFEQSKPKIRALFSKYNLSLTRDRIESWLVHTSVFEPQRNKDLWGFYWSVHKLFFGSPNLKKTLSSENLSVWMNSVSALVDVFCSYNHIWELDEFLKGRFAKSFFSATDQLLRLFRVSLERFSPEKVIPYSAIDEVLEAFPKVGSYPRDLKVKTLKTAVRIIVEKLISVPKPLRTQPEYLKNIYGEKFTPMAKGLNLDHLQRLESEYLVFKGLQKEIFASNLESAVPPAIDKYKTELKELIKNISVYFTFGQVGVTISSFHTGASEQAKKYNRKNLSLFNMFRLGIRFVAMGYSKRAYLLDDFSAIEKHEMTKFLGDFTDILFEYHVSDTEEVSEAASITERIYLEAKLFVSSSSGFARLANQKYPGHPAELVGEPGSAPITFTEAIEVMSHYFSSFSVFSGLFDEFIDQNLCGEGVEQPVFGRGSVDKKCFSKHYFKMINDRIPHLPNLKLFLAEYTKNEEQKIRSHTVPELKLVYKETLALISSLDYSGVFSERRILWAYGDIENIFTEKGDDLNWDSSERSKIKENFKFVRRKIKKNANSKDQNKDILLRIENNLFILESNYDSVESFVEILLKRAQVPDLWAMEELSFADFNILGTFVHYMETFFARYDQTDPVTKTINGKEIEEVFSGVKFILDQVIQERCVRQAFFDLVSSKEVPGAIDFFGFCNVSAPESFTDDLDVAIDRVEFVKLMNLLVNAIQ